MRGAAGLTAVRSPASLPPPPCLHHAEFAPSTPTTDASSHGPGGYCQDYGNQGPLSRLSGARTLHITAKIQHAPREGLRSFTDQDRRTTPSPPREASE